MNKDPRIGVIEKKVLIEASPSVVFQALTEGKDMARWFCDRVSSDPRIGGELRAFWHMGSGGKAQHGRAVFTNLVADSLVEMQWLDEGGDEVKTDPPEYHVTRYSIRIKRGTCEVTLRDEGPPLADEDSFSLLDKGWISVLRDLKDHCESRQRSARRHGADEPSAE